uniref:Uncharacterized protein n=1 Tax=Oryza glaberrima TaxID=4538 RepID=I1R5Q6_ORYGL
MRAQLDEEKKEQAVKMKGEEEDGVFSTPLSPEVGARPWVCCGAKEAPKVSDKWAQVMAVYEGERGGLNRE